MRKIIDPFSEALAESYVDGHLLAYQYDIDAKTGGDLDDFVQLFGLSRIPAQRAQGVVTFSRQNDDTAQQQALVVPMGTQVAALTNPIGYAQTTMAAVMDPGQLTVDAPVQAINAGTFGNIPAGLITALVTTGGVITNVINQAALTGGATQESDDQLRTRFKATVFRSLAGTTSMYAATAMEVQQDPTQPGTRAVSQINVIGSTKQWREQVQVVNGSAASTLINAAYIYPDNVYCGSDIDGGSFLQPGVHFTFVPSNPTNRQNATAVLSSLNATTMPDGFYDLVFDYVPQASRNDPANTRFGGGPIGNRIDLWCAGQKPDQASQSVVFSTAITFTATSSSKYYAGWYLQANPAQLSPSVGAVFVPLVFGPVLAVPNTLTIGGTVYTEGVDYWIVHRADCQGFAANSLFGLAWNTSRVPANGSTFSISYTYDRLPADVQSAINTWRLVGTDARAHAGKQVPLRLNLAIVYERAFDPTAVNTAIDAAVSGFLAVLGFDSQVQISDLVQVVHNVPGVDNVRFLTSGDDSSNYAVQVMSPYAASTVTQLVAQNGRAVDISFADDSYPVYHSSRIIQRAANNFRSGS